MSTILIATLSALLASTQVVWARSLVVPSPPDHLRPYVLPYLEGTVSANGDRAYRFPVTNLSSGGAMTLLTTNIIGSNGLSVFPHQHRSLRELLLCPWSSTVVAWQ